MFAAVEEDVEDVAVAVEVVNPESRTLVLNDVLAGTDALLLAFVVDTCGNSHWKTARRKYSALEISGVSIEEDGDEVVAERRLVPGSGMILPFSWSYNIFGRRCKLALLDLPALAV